MAKKINELNTDAGKSEPTVAEKIEHLQNAIAAMERLHARVVKAHERIENERNANK